jgi:nucleoid-associated protein YgaU
MAQMTREARFGLLLVVGLTSVIAFMVYKRLHQPSGLAAGTATSGQTQSPEQTQSPADSASAPPAGQNQGDGAIVPATAVADRTDFLEFPTPQSGAELQGTQATSASLSNNVSSPETAAAAAADEDPFVFETPPRKLRSTRPAASVEADDPFLAAPASNTPDPNLSGTSTLPEVKSASREDAPPRATATRSAFPVGQPEADPFAGADEPEFAAPNASSAKPLARPVATKSLTPAEDSVSESDTGTDPFTVPDRQATVGEPLLPGEATASSTTVVESAPAGEFSALRETGGQTLPSAGSGNAFRALDGAVYVVQPEDNYWLISKKVYGTGRYFQALMKHNESIVADPTRMRPGTQIATPNPEELLALYPDLIDGAAAASSTSTVEFPPGTVYLAQAGDNYWTISKKVYGTPRFFQALAEHNRRTIPDPLKLRAGTPVLTPPAEELTERYGGVLMAAESTTADTTPGIRSDSPANFGFFVDDNDEPFYRVGANDTLSGIAKAHLGRSSRWIQILEMNRDVLKDGTTLKIGTVLRLPPDASQIRVISAVSSGR